MTAITAKQLYRQTAEFAGKEVILQGWVRTLRASRNIGFIELNDGTFFRNVQVVFDAAIENFAEISRLPIATALRVRGEVKETPEMRQPFVIQALEISVEADSDASYPLQKKRHTLEYLRE